MVPASDGGVNEMRTCNRHVALLAWSTQSWGVPHNLSNLTRNVKFVLPVLVVPVLVVLVVGPVPMTVGSGQGQGFRSNEPGQQAAQHGTEIALEMDRLLTAIKSVAFFDGHGNEIKRKKEPEHRVPRSATTSGREATTCLTRRTTKPRSK